MKYMFSFKELKNRIVVIAAMLCLITVAACAAIPKERGGVPEPPELYGNYMFETTVYMNPLSSFYTFDGFVEYFTFSRDALVIAETNGLQRNIPAQYKRVAVDTKDFEATFDKALGIPPDISKYKERYQYTLNASSEINPVYRLYLMDSEVWLASMNNGSMWSIYKLTRYSGNIHWLPDEVSANKGAVIVVSGNNTVPALVYDGPSDAPLQDIKDKIKYLKIDLENNNDKLEPFSVYADGVEQFGSYNIYDAETFEAIDFFSPSGLSPQTYLLQNAEKNHSYIVELSVGEWDAKAENIIGDKFIFGVTIPK